MKILLLLFSFLFYQTAISQQVYPLHPSVGDTIELQEKLDYSLFSDIDNTTFQYATIQFKNQQFVLEAIEEIKDSTGVKVKSTTTQLSQEEIIEEQKKIQKINAYYTYLINRKKYTEAEKVTPKQATSSINLDTPMIEKMKKEARMMIRLKEDQRRANEFQLGLRSNNNIQFELNR